MTSDPVLINPEQLQLVLKAVISGPRARTTLRVWNAAILRIQRDTGEITVSGRQLAEGANINTDETYRRTKRIGP